MAAQSAPIQTAKVESFTGAVPKSSFRLPYDLGEVVKRFFGDALGDAGLKTSFQSDVDFMCGISDAGERIHMFDVESWCDRNRVFVANSKSAKLHRCREAFLILADRESYKTIGVLKRMYSEPTAFDRFNSSLLGELSPLAELTEIVIQEAEKLESERQRAAKFKFDHFWFASLEGAEAERLRRIHLDRIIAPVPLDTAKVIREGLDTFVPNRENEAKAVHAERQMRRRSERVEFISAVHKQADKLLADASLEYRDVWNELRSI